MPHYFFTLIEHNGTTTPDEEGVTFAHDARATEHAEKIAGRLAENLVREGRVVDDERIQVSRADGIISMIYVREFVNARPAH